MIRNKLTLQDSALQIMITMAEGNPGAVTALTEIVQNSQDIDPQAAMGPYGLILQFDDAGIYGTDIYVLWSDKCGRDVRRLIMWGRAVQLGLFSREKFKEMSLDQARQINLTEEEFVALDEQVCEQLAEFQRP